MTRSARQESQDSWLTGRLLHQLRLADQPLRRGWITGRLAPPGRKSPRSPDWPMLPVTRSLRIPTSCEFPDLTDSTLSGDRAAGDRPAHLEDYSVGILRARKIDKPDKRHPTWLSTLLATADVDPVLAEVLLGVDGSRYARRVRDSWRLVPNRMFDHQTGHSALDWYWQGLGAQNVLHHRQGRSGIAVFGWQLTPWACIDIDLHTPSDDWHEYQQQIARVVLSAKRLRQRFPNCFLEARYSPRPDGDIHPIPLNDGRFVHAHPAHGQAQLHGLHAWIRFSGFVERRPLVEALQSLTARLLPVPVEIYPQEHRAITLPLRMNESGSSSYEPVDDQLVPLVTRFDASGEITSQRHRQDCWSNFSQWRPDLLPGIEPLTELPPVVIERNWRDPHSETHQQRSYRLTVPDVPTDCRTLAELPVSACPSWVRLPGYRGHPSQVVRLRQPSTARPASVARAPESGPPARPALTADQLQALRQPIEQGERNARVVEVATAVRYGQFNQQQAEEILQQAHAGATCRGTFKQSLRALRTMLRRSGRARIRPPATLTAQHRQTIATLVDQVEGINRAGRPKWADLLAKMLAQCLANPDQVEKYVLATTFLRRFIQPRRVRTFKDWLIARGCRKVRAGRVSRHESELWDVRPLIALLTGSAGSQVTPET